MLVAELFATLGLLPDEKSWKEGHDLIEGLSHAIEGYLSVEAMKSVFEMFEGISEAADHAAKDAQRTGMAVAAIQELGHAAEMSDTSLGTLEAGLGKLDKTLDKFAKTGKGPVGDTLTKLGLSLRELQHDSPEQRIEDIAEAFTKIPDGAKKATYATQLFGGAGKSLIPLLNAGRDGIAGMRAEAHDLGIVIDEETAHKFEEFNDQQARVSKSFRGFKDDIAEAMLPVLLELVNGFYDWLRANREWLELALETVINGVITAFRALAKAVSVVIDFFRQHKEFVIATAAVIVGLLVPAFLSWAASAAIALAATLAPMLPIIAVVAALGVALKAMWSAFGGDDFTPTEVWEALKQLVSDFVDYISELPGRVLDWMAGVRDSIKNAFTDAWDFALATARRVVKELRQIVEDALELPLIKQLIEAGQALAGKGAASGIQATIAATYGPGGSLGPAKAAAEFDRASVPAAGAGGATVINGGDVRINVNGSGLTAEEVKSIILPLVGEAQTDALRQAYATIGGGKK